MADYLGVDLGGTKIGFVLADESGHFICEDSKSFSSPYKTTSRMLPDGEPEVVLDTVMTEIPMEKRVQAYLARAEADFLKAAKAKTGKAAYDKKGYSLCGKTWIQDGRIFMMGSNSPPRFATDLGNGRIGILVAEASEKVRGANDGNAAATAQGIYYKAVRGIEPRETGYFILGTGFGFGIPEYFALTEIGHIPAGFMPEWLWQECGCTQGHKTACAENYASGGGMKNTAETLLAFKNRPLPESVRAGAFVLSGGADLAELLEKTVLKSGKTDSKTIMDLAGKKSDGLAVFIAELAARTTAYAAVTSAQLFGLRIIGIGESVALNNPWHVRRISEIADAYLKGNSILRPPLVIEPTPLSNPAGYGALSLVVPESRYEVWAEKMKIK
ncbi:ROK family protein [bacterium]|nr:ROK family protein [bacterium]